MSLTLQLLHDSLIPHSPSHTVFAASDPPFFRCPPCMMMDFWWFLGLISFPSSGGLQCFVKAAPVRYYSVGKTIRVLRSKRYSVMASFLDLQLVRFMDRLLLTSFASDDEAMKGYDGNLGNDSSSLSMLCLARFLWGDLVNFDDGIVLDSSLEGFGISITRSDDNLMLNKVPVIIPEMYVNDWLVVHGIQGIVEGPEAERLTRSDGSVIRDGRVSLGR